MNNDLQIIILNSDNLKEYLSSIAKIHKKSYLKNHFTSRFSSKKLEEYYKEIINFSDLCLLAYKMQDREPVGFIISGYNCSKGIKIFTKKNTIYLIFLFLIYPRFLFEKLCNKIYILFHKNTENSAKYRLLSIAIDKNCQKNGIGSFLLSNFEDNLIKNNIYNYGLSVRIDNLQAINFYIKNGFKLEKYYLGSLYFVKNLK